MPSSDQSTAPLPIIPSESVKDKTLPKSRSHTSTAATQLEPLAYYHGEKSALMLPKTTSHGALNVESAPSTIPPTLGPSTVPETPSISHNMARLAQGILGPETMIGTPRAIGALPKRRSPGLLRHLTTPGFAHHRWTVDQVQIKTEPSCEDSDNESTTSSDADRIEDKAQLILDATRAQRDVCLAEKRLADCILKANTALGMLYKFEMLEAEKKLWEANVHIGYVRHSAHQSGVTLYEGCKPQKRRRTFADDAALGMETEFIPGFGSSISESEPAHDFAVV